MIEEILRSLYKIEVPLPHNPLKAVNSYFIKSAERNLVIDPGMNLPECKTVVLSAIQKLNFDLSRTDFFITHFHPDHLELAASIATRTSRLFLNKREVTILNNPDSWKIYRSYYLKHGFPEEELCKMETNHLVQSFIAGGFGCEFINIDGNNIQVGDYSFKCLETSGHSPGHICLYDTNKKILISGDHILFDITPNITGGPGVENPLKIYLENLDKVYPLEVNLVLPGHRSIQSNHRKRILELKEHHQKRAQEVIKGLNSEWKTAYQIAPLISWDVDYRSWEQFPPAQKFFATAEAVAHLNYLEAEGVLRSKMNDGEKVYSN